MNLFRLSKRVFGARGGGAERRETRDRSNVGYHHTQCPKSEPLPAKMCVWMHCDSRDWSWSGPSWWIWFCLVLAVGWSKDHAMDEGAHRNDERKESQESTTLSTQKAFLCQICSYGAFIPIGKTVFKFSRFVFLYLKTIISSAPFYPFLFILFPSDLKLFFQTLQWTFVRSRKIPEKFFGLKTRTQDFDLDKSRERPRWLNSLCYIFLIVFSFLMTAWAHISCCCALCLFKIQKAIDCILSRFDFVETVFEASAQIFWVIKHAFIVGLFGIPRVFPFLCVAQKCVNAFTVRESDRSAGAIVYHGLRHDGNLSSVNSLV